MSKLGLNEVKNNFSHWRANRNTSKSKIPEYLWDQVLGLISDYSTAEIITTLGLSGSQFNNKKKAHQQQLKKQDEMNFFEVPITTKTKEQKTVLNVTNKIELKRPDGATISIEQLPTEALTHILNQFMQAI